MDWVELSLRVPAKDADRAADIANMVVPYGLYIEDYSDLEQGAREIAHIDLIDEELLQKDREQAILHLYLDPAENPAEALAFLSERFSAAQIPFAAENRTVCDTDWANNWKKYFKPLPVGDRLLICPTWEEPVGAEGRAVLSIDPGLAFGTGGHDTTRLVLEELSAAVTPQTEMLDVGCGSGILSIAALLLGAKNALGIDIDPLAVKTAAENGALNGFTPPRFTDREGNLARDVAGQYDLIAANIVADAILALSPAVRPLLKPDGLYIVSGIIDSREQEVVAGLAACGFTPVKRREHGGWLCFVCRGR